jgi:hypothetical protein
MNRGARRSWEVSFLKHVANPPIDICAICRQRLTDRCCECTATNNDDAYQIWCHTAWHTLLLCYNRRDCIVSSLDISTLSRIFSFVIGSTRVSNNCPTVIVCENAHEFHTHCWNRWSVRRSECPLDGLRPLDDVISDDSAAVCGHLLSVGQFEQSYDVRQRKRRLHERLDAQIITLLKPIHREGGYTFDYILMHTTCIDGVHLQTVLKNLIDRDWIRYEDTTDTYVYLP